MEYRQLGNTGEKLSIVGFGGILAAREDQGTANKLVDEALDAGVNYFDTAPTYFDAEDRMGPALRNKRNRVFLACKTENRTRQGAWDLLTASLQKLGTDHFDLYQFHAVTTMEEVETIFGPGGAMESFEKAKREGLIRYIGFSAHSQEAALALMARYRFDSVLYPFNWVNLLEGSFSLPVLDEAKKQNMGILALKGMARTKLAEGAEKILEKTWYEPLSEERHAKLAFRYTLAQGITAALSPGYLKWFRWALETASPFQEPSKEEIEELRILSRGVKPLFPLG